MRSCSSLSSGGWLFAVQCLIGIAALMAMARPPLTTGKILLVPLTPAAGGTLAPLAVAHGARLIGTGPLPGSLIVFADGRTLIPPLLRQGIVSVASPSAGCTAAIGARA